MSSPEQVESAARKIDVVCQGFCGHVAWARSANENVDFEYAFSETRNRSICIDMIGLNQSSRHASVQIFMNNASSLLSRF